MGLVQVKCWTGMDDQKSIFLLPPDGIWFLTDLNIQTHIDDKHLCSWCIQLQCFAITGDFEPVNYYCQTGLFVCLLVDFTQTLNRLNCHVAEET